MDIDKSTKTIRNYKRHVLNKANQELYFLFFCFLLLCLFTFLKCMFIGEVISNTTSKPNLYEFLKIMSFISLFVLVNVILTKFFLKTISKYCIHIDNLYANTMLESFYHYYYPNRATAIQDKNVDKISKLFFWGSNSQIADILLDLDKKIQLLIDEDNRINGFGYVVTRNCYDIIIEKINEAEDKIKKIKDKKNDEMINHFRNIVN